MTLCNDIFRFAIIAEQLELNLKEFIFTISMSVPVPGQLLSLCYWLCYFSNFCIPLWSGSFCHIFHSSSHMAGTISVYGPYCSILNVLQVFSQVCHFCLCFLPSFCSIASKFLPCLACLASFFFYNQYMCFTFSFKFLSFANCLLHSSQV